jgi:hypothetical protein
VTKKREQFDVMEDLLKEEQVAIGVVDQKAQKLLKETKEAHAKADARIDACVKLQVDLERCVSDISWRELAVVGQEWELQEKEEENTHKLERESDDLKSCTNDLNTCEAALEAESECLRKTHEDLYTSELSISSQEGTLEHRAIALNFKEKEPAKKEMWLAETGLQELATTRKMVEELQVAWAVEAHKVWDFLG